MRSPRSVLLLWALTGHELAQVAMLSELSKVKEENQSLSSSVSDIAAQHLQKSVLKMRMAMVLKVNTLAPKSRKTIV